MGISAKVCSFIIWCSIFLVKNVQSQGFYYKPNNVNQYQIVNGKYELITTTTPPPSLLETIFPSWGNAYDSSKTPEEDDAILNSISDLHLDSSNVSPTVTDSEGYFSWFSFPSIPGFGSSSETTEPSTNGGMMGGPPPPNSMGFPPMGPPPPGMGFPPGPPPPAPNPMDYPPGALGPAPPNMMGAPSPMGMFDTYDTNGLGPMMSSASQNEVAVLPPPGHMQMNPNPMQPSQYPPMPPPNAIPNEIRNNLNPTFQFHQNVMDSIPVPSPSLSSALGPPPPYAYTASFQYGTQGATNERPLPQSFIDTLTSYFNMGKRSDLDGKIPVDIKKAGIESRSDAPEEMYYSGDQGTIDLRDWASFVEKAGEESDSESDDDSESADSTDEESDDMPTAPVGDTQANKSSDIKDFPCPKSGIWRWNGEVCIAVGPVPVWACKPNDLTVSGKIAICRNKIYFSPKVINTDKTLHVQQQRRFM